MSNLALPMASPLALLAQKQYGRPSLLVPSVVVFGVALSTVVKNNPARIGLTIINSGYNTIALGWPPYPTGGAGITLTGSGGILQLTVAEDGELCGWEMYGTCSAGNQTVSLFEEVLL